MGRGNKVLAEIAKQIEAKKRQAKPKVEKGAPVIPIDSFTAKHGDYAREGVKIRNRYVTTVERWRTDKHLDERQMRAVELCDSLWQRAYGEAKVVANLMGLPGGGSGEGFGWVQEDARRELYWFQARIPGKYWSVWENVCRFDHSGGQAGKAFDGDDKRKARSSLLIVQFVADLICSWKHL